MLNISRNFITHKAVTISRHGLFDMSGSNELHDRGDSILHWVIAQIRKFYVFILTALHALAVILLLSVRTRLQVKVWEYST